MMTFYNKRHNYLTYKMKLLNEFNLVLPNPKKGEYYILGNYNLEDPYLMKLPFNTYK
jgi:hypothetical protein